MPRKMQYPRVMEQMPDELSSGDEGDTHSEEEENGSQKTPTNSQDPPTGIESPFGDETPEQVKQRLAVLEATNQELSNQIQAARNKPVDAPPKEKPERTPISAADFWADPAAHTRKLIGEEVKDLLEEVITPFRQDLAKTQEKSEWDAVRNRFPDFGDYEELIRSMLQRTNQPATAGLLEQFYYTAKGYVATNRGTPVNPSTPRTSDGQPRRDPPPQHRASNQPSPTPRTERREPTEEERWAMKVGGFVDYEEYLRWKNADEDAVNSMSREPAKG